MNPSSSRPSAGTAVPVMFQPTTPPRSVSTPVSSIAVGASVSPTAKPGRSMRSPSSCVVVTVVAPVASELAVQVASQSRVVSSMLAVNAMAASPSRVRISRCGVSASSCGVLSRAVASLARRTPTVMSASAVPLIELSGTSATVPEPATVPLPCTRSWAPDEPST